MLREDRTTRGDEIYSYAIRSCAKVCVKRTLCSCNRKLFLKKYRDNKKVCVIIRKGQYILNSI